VIEREETHGGHLHVGLGFLETIEERGLLCSNALGYGCDFSFALSTLS
jgi:hypothetical protein